MFAFLLFLITNKFYKKTKQETLHTKTAGSLQIVTILKITDLSKKKKRLMTIKDPLLDNFETQAHENTTSKTTIYVGYWGPNPFLQAY